MNQLSTSKTSILREEANPTSNHRLYILIILSLRSYIGPQSTPTPIIRTRLWPQSRLRRRPRITQRDPQNRTTPIVRGVQNTITRRHDGPKPTALDIETRHPLKAHLPLPRAHLPPKHVNHAVPINPHAVEIPRRRGSKRPVCDGHPRRQRTRVGHTLRYRLAVRAAPGLEVDLAPGAAAGAVVELPGGVNVAHVGGDVGPADGLEGAVAADAHYGFVLQAVDVVVEGVVAYCVDFGARAADGAGEDGFGAGLEVDL